MILVCMRIKEEEEINTIILAAHYLLKNHIAAGICSSIEVVINNGVLWLERLEISITKLYTNYQHNIPSLDKLHLGKLRGSLY